MSMKDYKVYAFDMDLTLLDTIETSKYAYKASMGDEYDENKVVNYLAVPLSTTYEEMKHFNGSYDDFVLLFKTAARESFLSGAHFYPDALEIIVKLHKMNKKLAIITNRDTKVVIDILKKEQIYDYFSSIITVDRVSKLKPDPEPMYLCLKECECNKEDMVYIGDAKNDYLSATRAGIDFVAVERYNNCNFEAKIKINNLNELLK